MAKSKLVKVNEKIADNVVGGYKKIEEGVVGGYKKIEEGAVGGFNKIADKFVDNEQKAREEAGKAQREERSAHQNGIVEKNMQKAQNAAAEARRKAGME